MSERSLILLLEDMQESTLKILNYVAGHDFNTFFQDEKTKDAMVRNFEIIGEAANKIDEKFRLDNPDIKFTNSVNLFQDKSDISAMNVKAISNDGTSVIDFIAGQHEFD